MLQHRGKHVVFEPVFLFTVFPLLVRRQREPTAVITPSESLERKPARLLQAYLNLLMIYLRRGDCAALRLRADYWDFFGSFLKRLLFGSVYEPPLCLSRRRRPR